MPRPASPDTVASRKRAAPDARRRPSGSAREAILDAALQTFRAKGYAATSVDDLCRAAGVTKGAFFHHFESKEAAALASVEHWNATTGALFEAAAYQREDDPRARLLAYLDTRDGWAAGAPAEYSCLLGTLLQETHASHPALRAGCASGILAHARTLVPTIEAARARHAPDADWRAEDLAEHIQAVLQGAFVLGKAHGDAAPVRAAILHLRRYVELLLPLNAGKAGPVARSP